MVHTLLTLKSPLRASMPTLSSDRVPSVKVVLLGEGRVGKTSLLLRWANDSFDLAQSPTLQASFLTKTLTIDGAQAEVNVWDTAGQERFRSLGPIYYRGADAAVLVYDVTSEASFARVRSWIKELRQMVDGTIVLAIAGNKQDSDPADWRVPHAEASSFAAAVGASHFRTSARTGDGVGALFCDAAQRGLAARTARSDAPGGRGQGTAISGSRQRGLIVLDERLEHPAPKQSSCC